MDSGPSRQESFRNTASIALHKKHGFRVRGTREKVGKMAFGELQGKWRNVILLERRSKVVAVDSSGI
jgi:phosphinothricin acetyltransferase